MKIAVGLSGGVDSSVAALLLKQQGYDIFGLFMQNWNDASVTLHGSCTWEDDLDLARMTARVLDIPFHHIDLSAEYKKRVVDYMFREYEAGRTPNPDVLCNREIKFDAFLAAAQALGADMVATGHYCQRGVLHSAEGDVYQLLAGADPNKDQSYFLCQLNQAQLSRALFPIGHLLKPEVRRLAAEAGLPTADRKDSQGICFVGKVDLPVFLQQQLKPKAGQVVEIFADFYPDAADAAATNTASAALLPSATPSEAELEAWSRPFVYQATDGKVIGQHQGAFYYTIGQRKGLNIGGHVEPLFVIATDMEQNVIYVGEGASHPGLFRRALWMEGPEVHWIRPSQTLRPGESRPLLVRIRYRQPLQKATLHCRERGLYIVFDDPQRGVTAGQFAAWYDAEGELLGSGVIKR